ncbi:hypothetical protein J4465_01430 [Candidatus Pacearchaeota archaeon]|nr:hypothetical protein [Candidatus Pacearchaeota archaeon]
MSEQNNTQPKDIFSLDEIAEHIITHKLLAIHPEKGKRDLLKELKEGKLVVAIMNTGEIRNPSKSTHYFLDFNKEGEVIDYKIGVSFFSSYVPVIENGQIKGYERIKK